MIPTLARRAYVYPTVLAFALGLITAGIVFPLSSSPQEPGASLATAGDSPVDNPDEGRPQETAESTIPDGGASAPGNRAGTPTTAPERANETTELTASDIGVTPSLIEIGIAVLDTSRIEMLGLAPPNFTTEGQIDFAEAFIDDLNQRGGINGRTVIPNFAMTDPTNGDSATTACQQLTEDHQVFAVLGSIGGAAQLCVTEQHQTPLITPTAPSAYYDASNGLLITTDARLGRGFRGWANRLDQLGHLDGRTVGILSDASIDPDVDGSLVPLLQQLGHEPYVYSLSSDIQTASSQIPIAVQQMKSRGVDALLVPTAFLYLVQFTRSAESQGFRPQYMVTDANGLTIDSLVAGTGDSFDGAIGITFVRGADFNSGEPEPTVDAACRTLYNDATGSSVAYGAFPYFQLCSQLIVFESAAAGAGPSLTRTGFASAVTGSGNIALPGLYGGSFGTGKTDYADLLRPLVFRKSCNCWHTDGDVRPGQF